MRKINLTLQSPLELSAQSFAGRFLENRGSFTLIAFEGHVSEQQKQLMHLL
jgi:hypothetical protein